MVYCEHDIAILQKMTRYNYHQTYYHGITIISYYCPSLVYTHTHTLTHTHTHARTHTRTHTHITQVNPLKSPAFEQILCEPVPQQNSHLGKPWFHEKLSRQQAEDMLKRVRMDGAFLIRPSEQQKDTYSISFR